MPAKSPALPATSSVLPNLDITAKHFTEQLLKFFLLLFITKGFKVHVIQISLFFKTGIQIAD